MTLSSSRETLWESVWFGFCLQGVKILNLFLGILASIFIWGKNWRRESGREGGERRGRKFNSIYWKPNKFLALHFCYLSVHSSPIRWKLLPHFTKEKTRATKQSIQNYSEIQTCFYLKCSPLAVSSGPIVLEDNEPSFPYKMCSVLC